MCDSKIIPYKFIKVLHPWLAKAAKLDRRQNKKSIGTTISIGQEIRCLLYAEFFQTQTRKINTIEEKNKPSTQDVNLHQKQKKA